MRFFRGRSDEQSSGSDHGTERTQGSTSKLNRTPQEDFGKGTSNLQITDNDVIILVMGVTGSGKSRFIGHLTKLDVEVGHNLDSCTADVNMYPCTYKDGSRIFLIDTPGFDESVLTDTDILRMVAYFLATTYSRKIKLAGIIYLHPISATRMTGSAVKNLALFKALCGTRSLEHVVLATTFWDLFAHPSSEHGCRQREKALAETPDYWGDMLDSGSKMFRYQNTDTSAWQIIEHIMLSRGRMVLDIQQQMIDQRRALSETSAGQIVECELQKQRLRYEKKLEHVRETLDAPSSPEDKELTEILTSEEANTTAAMRRTKEEVARLKVDYTQLQAEEGLEYQKRLRLLDEALKQQKSIADESQAALKQLRTETSQLRSELDQLHASSTREKEAVAGSREPQREPDSKQVATTEMERQARVEQVKTSNLLIIVQSIAGLALTGAGTISGNNYMAITGAVMIGHAAHSAASCARQPVGS
ncbi:P-loop containing nucleoside triphosphate hydrolase protein [Pyrenochaeta sp. MPI-SDFR-AT-0127]|nr:P-loop containing nucleoside triphosphate hydrolase protein [Pyrenochaeta sp. MPI-SDFR-AT-0127]